MEKELQDLLRDIGKDISELRKGLVGTTKSILDNAKVTKTHSSAQKLLIAQQEQNRKLLKERNLLTEEAKIAGEACCEAQSADPRRSAVPKPDKTRSPGWRGWAVHHDSPPPTE